MEIQEGNKIIAEFDELLRDKDAYADGTFGYRWKDNYTYHLDQLQYHTSWDWLMPVWKKANEIIIGNAELKARILMAIADVEIEKAANYIVQLIQWHNNQHQ